MFTIAGPYIAGVALLAISTLIGMVPVVKLIRVREARRELKQGSAGFLRTISGWVVIAFWIMGTWYIATIIGDWGATGDPEGAIGRSWLRLRILLEIAAALVESD